MNEVQFVRDTAAKLLEQGKYCAAEKKCLYREHGNASDPVRCGIGHHIPDELYELGMEAQGAMLLLRGFPQVRTAITEKYGPCEDEERIEWFVGVVQRELHDGRSRHALPLLTEDEAVAAVEARLGRNLRGAQ